MLSLISYFDCFFPFLYSGKDLICVFDLYPKNLFFCSRCSFFPYFVDQGLVDFLKFFFVYFRKCLFEHTMASHLLSRFEWIFYLLDSFFSHCLGILSCLGLRDSRRQKTFLKSRRCFFIWGYFSLFGFGNQSSLSNWISEIITY